MDDTTKTSHDHKHCWVYPEDALDYLNRVGKFGENDKPIQISECFQVWGRGRPRPHLDQIILPKGTTLQSNIPKERLTKGRGRGYLLLGNSTFDNDIHPSTSADMFNPNLVSYSAFDKNLKEFRKNQGQSKAACRKMTLSLKDIEDKYNKKKYLSSQKPLFDIHDFPPLK